MIMKKTWFLVLALAAASAAATPAQDREWSTRIMCELQNARPQSLQALYWQQGTTPLLSLDQYRSGRSLNADSNITAIVRFAPSATDTYMVSVTNYAVSGNGYLVQMPSIGTNTTAGAWWYTAYFLRDGATFWTGNGRLEIEETTSTGDALNWQEITPSATTAQIDTNTADIAALDVRVTANSATGVVHTAQIAANSATGAIHTAAIAILEGQTNLINSALQPTDTNGWVVSSHAAFLTAETDPVWVAVSNVVTAGAAAGATALQAEADTLASVSARGGFAGTETISPLNIVMGGYWQALQNTGTSTIDATAYGASQSGGNEGTQTIGEYSYGARQNTYNYGTQTIGDSAYGASQSGLNLDTQTIGRTAYGASQSGYNDGTQTIGDSAYGASQSGYNDGTQTIGNSAYGASQSGQIAATATATNNAVGAIQLHLLTSGQHALTTSDGAASLMLGAGVSSNKNAIVAGDGNYSHGDGSITATSFHGSGAALTGVSKPADLADYTTFAQATNIVTAADAAPYAITVASGTATVSRASGNWAQSLTLTAPAVLNVVAASSTLLNGIRLDIVAGTNALTYSVNATNIVSGLADIEISTNDTTSIFFDSPFGKTSWKATEL